MSELTPITRVESYLDAIVNSGTPPLEDITRIETFLQAIYDNQVCALTPITRIEMFLGKISGQDIVLPEPITRIELYLAAIAGEDVELPENPITRLEMYLAEWADSGDWTTISGAIVEFIATRAHKLKSCVVSLSPQQDLHGYDSPWPGCGTAQKWDEQWENGSFDDNGSPVSNPNRIRTKNYIPVTSGASYYLRDAGTDVFFTFVFYDSSYAVVSVKSGASGGIHNGSTITIDSGVSYVKFSPADAYGATYGNNISFNYPSTDHDYHPYSNICPISGWTGCEVYLNNGNQWDEVCELGTLNGDEEVPSTTNLRTTNYIPVKPNTQFYFCCSSGSVFVTRQFYDKNKNYISGSYTQFFSNTVITVPSNAYYLRFYLSGTYGTTYNHDISINYPSNDTEYHAYTGNSYSVTFGETVYGGTPDIVNGDMSITKVKYTFTWGNYLAEYAPQGNQFKRRTFQLPATLVEGSGHSITNCLGAYSTQVPTTTPYFYVSNPYAYFWLPLDTADDFTIELCGELATPVEVPITPTPITALKGYNAMWSDGGDIEVTVHGTPVEVETLQALNMLLGGAYRNNQTADDVSDDEALEIILGGEQR